MKVKRIFILLFIFLLLPYHPIGNRKVYAASVAVPISITVNGKMIITDPAEESNSGAGAPEYQQAVKLKKSGTESSYHGKAAIRVRSNLKDWRLVAKRAQAGKDSVEEENFYLIYTLSAGSKANSAAAILTKPFLKPVSLGSISPKEPSTVLVGTSNTSNQQDPGNGNNYLELGLEYNYFPSEETIQADEMNTIVSYGLVSP